MFKKSGHSLEERRRAEERALGMGSYYSQETTCVPLPDGGKVTVTQSNRRKAGKPTADVVVTDKNGRVLQRTRRLYRGFGN